MMLSYNQALERILTTVSRLPETEEVPLRQAAGRVLGHDIYAAISLPPFDNTAVDGFAVRAEDTKAASAQNPVPLTIIETVAAGSVPTQTILPGQAARILTGAMLPNGADALVMVEDTREPSDDHVEVLTPASARFIRHAGSDLPSGALALAQGADLDAGAIGLLASLGNRSVSCVRQPRVAILTTGDEIYQGEGDLPTGCIYNSNGPALIAAVEQTGATVALHRHIGDDPATIRDALHEASVCDVVLTAGGVSVGQYDFVKAAVEAIGSLDFWRIAIKPGKPLAFGRIGNALFFGLPGNPVSALVTFELFVWPTLRKLAGYSRIERPVIPVVLGAALRHETGRREFARARIQTEKAGETPRLLRVIPLGLQDSHRLSSLASADVLLIAHEDHSDYAIGETLPAILL